MFDELDYRDPERARDVVVPSTATSTSRLPYSTRGGVTSGS
jgi:hypothetical protein